MSFRFAAARIASTSRSSAVDVAVEPLRRLLRRELLEHGAHGVDLDQLGLAEPAHARAAKRLRLDEPQQLEIAQRLAHRRLARAELVRDARLDEPLARLQLAADDAVEQDVLHLLAQHGSRDRAHAVPAATIRHRRRPRQACGDDRVRERADAVDLDRDLVAGLQQPLRVAEDADAGRRPGEDQVARLEGRRLRRVADDLVDPEDQVRRRRVLHDVAVQDRADPERVRIADVGGRDERADRAERVRRLAARPLAVAELEVARGDVVRDDVAGDRLERVLLRDALHGRADHDAELGLVVALRHERRDHDRIAGPDQRGRELREEERRRRELGSLLLRVILVVEPDADDLARGARSGRS